jgi:hypothetical protein
MRALRVLLVIAVVSCGLPVGDAAAGGRVSVIVHGAPRAFVPPRSVFPTPGDPWRSWGVSRQPHHVFGIPRAGAGFYTSGVYASAPVLDYVGPQLSVAASPSVPPVIEYSTGWYELQGDGITSAHRWVWIPKPPLPPPSPPPPPAAPPGLAPSAGPEPPPLPRAPHEVQHVYRWTDEAEVVHLTDRLENVPARYRAQL